MFGSLFSLQADTSVIIFCKSRIISRANQIKNHNQFRLKADFFSYDINKSYWKWEDIQPGKILQILNSCQILNSIVEAACVCVCV